MLTYFPFLNYRKGQRMGREWAHAVLVGLIAATAAGS